jgi:hypothetical protein
MTVPLGGAQQYFVGGDHATADTLQVDALGGCATVGAGSIEIPGSLVIQHAAFEAVEVINTCVDTIFLDGFESVIP